MKSRRKDTKPVGKMEREQNVKEHLRVEVQVNGHVSERRRFRGREVPLARISRRVGNF